MEKLLSVLMNRFLCRGNSTKVAPTKNDLVAYLLLKTRKHIFLFAIITSEKCVFITHFCSSELCKYVLSHNIPTVPTSVAFVRK